MRLEIKFEDSQLLWVSVNGKLLRYKWLKIVKNERRVSGFIITYRQNV